MVYNNYSSSSDFIDFWFSKQIQIKCLENKKKIEKIN